MLYKQIHNLLISLNPTLFQRNNDDFFTTELKLVVVQDGYIGGEVIHSESVEMGGGYLHARITGDIITQFKINGAFVDEDSLSADVLAKLPFNITTRSLIHIKRVRGLQFVNAAGDASGWSQNREYRLILQDNTLGCIPNHMQFVRGSIQEVPDQLNYGTSRGA